MKRIILDTNIIISAILFGGKPQQVLSLIIDSKLELYLSETILSEINSVLNREKFNIPKDYVIVIMKQIRSISNIVSPDSQSKGINISRDKADNKFIHCAIEANADYIITGDQDLLVLKQINHIKILPPKEFLELTQS